MMTLVNLRPTFHTKCRVYLNSIPYKMIKEINKNVHQYENKLICYILTTGVNTKFIFKHHFFRTKISSVNTKACKYLPESNSWSH